MTQATNTYDTYDAVGNREDLSDIIYDISPTDTPFLSAVPDGKATSTLHEWQTDALAAASSSNAHIQGDEFSGDAQTATTRLTNRTQISKKQIVISDTQEVVDKAGRDSEMAYQEAKALKELKRDMEAILTGNQASVTGTNTVASKLRSLEAWYSTNVSRGSGGASGSTTQAATDATTGDRRALTEDMVLDVAQSTWQSGGNPTILMTGAFNKRITSGFAGGASKTVDVEIRKLVQAVDVYDSDFGDFALIANRFSRSRVAHLIDPTLWAVSYLRPVFSEPIAKTGDAHKKHIVTEYTLEARNEAGSGVIADLTDA